MERPPRTVEYICLQCGTQGSIHAEADGEESNRGGGHSLKCPKCGSTVLYLERETADEAQRSVPVEKN